MRDIVIIGAGVTGSSIARELSKRKLDILVVDKASDVCEGTSKANSGIVHGGFDAKTGSLKAKLNVEGNRLMEEYSKELDFPFERNGSLVLIFDEADREKLELLKKQGDQNGVENVQIIDRDEVKRMEPNISDNVIAALYVPTGGIVCPFNLTIAMAENAAANGVEFSLNTEVMTIEKIADGYNLSVNKTDDAGNISEEHIDTKIVINATGVYADKFHNMVSDKKINIIARKGEYMLLDKKVGKHVNHTLFQLPTAYGKGVLVTRTVHGNVLIGPTAKDIEDKEGVNTTQEALDEVIKKAGLSVKNLPVRQVITSFSGLRAHEENGDFIIEECEDAKGFIDVAGIESPGLTCAPAIGRYVADIVDNICNPEINEQFVAKRKGITAVATADKETVAELIKENPLYANVVCRCELVTEGEIVDAITRPVGATTLDGVKRRTRAGMGRCQAGFCSPKVVDIIARELGKKPEDISKCGGNSTFLV